MTYWDERSSVMGVTMRHGTGIVGVYVICVTTVCMRTMSEWCGISVPLRYDA